uniref:hypothetical protein n=1 Tax=Streptomyces sp. PTD9-10 TaxID=3120151 RepID=UPI00300B78B0
TVPAVAWDGDLDRLARDVSDHEAPVLRIAGVPNARLSDEVAAARELGQEDSLASAVPALDPGDVPAWAAVHGWDAVVTWSADAVDRMDVLVFRDDPVAGRILTGTYLPTAGERTLVNDPVAAGAITALLPTLRAYLRETLPEYMVPA